jgi:hypothetical protein
MTLRIAYFISSHGFGHAARSAAVMHELHRQIPTCTFEIFTLVPEWFFTQSLPNDAVIQYHPLLTDIGFVQQNPIEEDLGETVRQLDLLYPLRPELVTRVAAQLSALKVSVVVSDIAVVGIAAARLAGVPSVLIENFTWDWMYSSYLEREPKLRQFIDYLEPLFTQATHRIQAEPVCVLNNALKRVAPIARAVREPPLETRKALGISPESQTILISMGGIPMNYDFFDALAAAPLYHFIVAGASAPQGMASNITALPANSGIYHPDLVASSDAIVGKVGYSTVCEAYFGRTQFFFIPRPLFPESIVMERFVSEQLNGRAIEAEQFSNGSWVSKLPQLFLRVDPPGSVSVLPENGAVQAAREIRFF